MGQAPSDRSHSAVAEASDIRHGDRNCPGALWRYHAGVSGPGLSTWDSARVRKRSNRSHVSRGLEARLRRHFCPQSNWDSLRELSKQPMTAAQIARALALSSRAVPDFPDALVALGFLQRAGDGPDARYSNTPESAMFLDRNSSGYIGGILEMANARLYRFWADLTEALKTGVPQNETKHSGEPMFAKLYEVPERLEQFMNAMSGISAGNFNAFAHKFNFCKVLAPMRCRRGDRTAVVYGRGSQPTHALHQLRSSCRRTYSDATDCAGGAQRPRYGSRWRRVAGPRPSRGGRALGGSRGIGAQRRRKSGIRVASGIATPPWAGPRPPRSWTIWRPARSCISAPSPASPLPGLAPQKISWACRHPIASFVVSSEGGFSIPSMRAMRQEISP